MEVVAKSKSIKMSPRKVRLVVDAIVHLSVKDALNALFLSGKRTSTPVLKTIKSAVANAIHNAKINKDSLFIKRIDVTEGPVYKRFRPSTRGRVHPYKKRSSHLTVVLEERKKN